MSPKLLLHSCCAPDEIVGIMRLRCDWDITIFFYNPNIFPTSEYLKRRDEAQRIAQLLSIPFTEGNYNTDFFIQKIKGLENEPEKGARCEVCIDLRLETAADYAKKNNFSHFGTVLSVSPHKSISMIRASASKASYAYTIQYLDVDLKKKNGFLESLGLCKEYAIYRQNYCGCQMSMAHLDSAAIIQSSI